MPQDVDFSIGTREFGDPLDSLTPAQRLAQRFEDDHPESTPIIPTRLYSMRLPVDVMLRVDTFAEMTFRPRVRTVTDLIRIGLDAVCKEMSKEGRQRFEDAVAVEVEKFCAEYSEKQAESEAA